MNSDRSLRARLSWYMVLVMFLTTLISGGSVFYGTMHEAEEIFGASLIRTARILDGIMTRESIESRQDELLAALAATDLASAEIRELSEYEEQLFLIIMDADGGILLETPSAPRVETTSLSTGFNELAGGEASWLSFMLHSHDDDLRIIVGASKGLRNELAEYILSGMLWPLVIMLPLSLALLLYLIHLALRPLSRVGEEVLGQDFRNLKPVNVAGVPNEISPLVTSFNQMITTLDQAYQRERRFVSDASHELRNPLAALLINAENALEENQDPELAQSLGAMYQSIQRLKHLVSQLLHLSHSENPLEQLNFDQVDISGICQRIVDRQHASASARQQTLTFTRPPQPCVIRGSEPLLESLLSNLVENAIRYAGHGNQIRVGCERLPNQVVLRVEDSGPGVDQNLLSKITERFFRGDAQDTRGAGLGLSIVRAIADAHDASLKLDKSELGGLSVTLGFAAR